MSYDCKILADSISPDGVRLTTLCCQFPRFILAEVNTHRMLSRNSASSRAIPPEKLIERVQSDPFIPETFNKRVKGMGVGDPLDKAAAEDARALWLAAMSESVQMAGHLAELDVDKSRVNRLLEPFMWHTAIISATEWDNFFALRDHPDAQPEFQIIAKMMREVMEESKPQELDYDWWHLPLVAPAERWEHGDPGPVASWEWWAMVSAGRCARVSFDTHHNYESGEDSHTRSERLKSSGHLSPFEHVARPLHPGEGNYHIHTMSSGDHDPVETFVGNFRGWVQLRKQIPHESNFRALMAEA